MLERQGRKQSERASQATRKSGHVHVSPRPYRYSRSRVRRLQLLIDSIQALGDTRTKQDLLDEIDDLQQENEDLRSQLAAVADIVAPPDEEDDDVDDDDSD